MTNLRLLWIFCESMRTTDVSMDYIFACCEKHQGKLYQAKPL